MKTLATLALALLAQTAQAQFSSTALSNFTATPSLVNRDLTLNLDLTLTACATVDVSITGAVQVDVADVIFSQATILLEADVCLCVVLGVFTSTAIDKLTAIVHSDVSAARLAPYYAANKGSSPASVLAILLGNLLGQMPQDNCEYPANSTPNDDTCSATCSYTCNQGYMPCGESCYDPNTQTCQSGYPANNQRRSLSRRRNNANLRCASGQTICEVPNLTSNSAMNRLECIDTMANAESCGGCMYPSPGQVEGEDCTAIPNVAGVRCVTGRCIVESCARGFLLSDGDCIARKRLGGNVSHKAASNLLDPTDELVFKPKAMRRVMPVTSDQKRRTV